MYSREVTSYLMKDELEVLRVGPRIATEDTGPVIPQEMLVTSAGAMAGGV